MTPSVQSRSAKTPAPASRAAALVMGGAKAKYLLETIVCGAYESAMQVAALALLLGVCARTGDASRVLSFRHILIDDSEVMLFALSYGEDIGLRRRRRSKPYATSIAGSPAPSATSPSCWTLGTPASSSAKPHIARRSRGASIVELARAAIEHLQKAVKPRLHETYERDARTVVNFLRQAAAGDDTAFDSQGALRLPRLEQRRACRACRSAKPVKSSCRAARIARNWRTSRRKVSPSSAMSPPPLGKP